MIKLPSNLRTKRLADGRAAYYWELPTKDRKAGCALFNEALGRDPASAINRAEELNRDLRAWRHRDQTPTGPLPGTVAWLFAKVAKHELFTKLAPATQRGYRQGLRLMENHRLKGGMRFGDVPANAVRPKHADALYDALLDVEEVDPETGDVAMRRRRPMVNAAVRAARRAWSIGMRMEWVRPPAAPPFQKMGRPGLDKNEEDAVEAEAPLWRRDQVSAFVAKADERGCPEMGTAAVLAFELCQRQRDVIGGGKRKNAGLRWSGYRSIHEHGLQGAEIKLRQNKTGRWVWIPLCDEQGPLFPEVVARLEAAPRSGELMIMRGTPDRRTGEHLPYKEDHFRHLFREIADAAGLPRELCFKHLRHSGLTELGNAGATDQELMSHSGHQSRQMLNSYARATSGQALRAAQKRRAMIEILEANEKVGEEASVD